MSHDEIENLGLDPFVPNVFMGCSPLLRFASTKTSPRMDSTSSSDRLCAVTTESCPLYQPEEFIDDPAAVPIESSITWSSNQPLPSLTDPNHYGSFDINHVMPPLCRPILPIGEVFVDDLSSAQFTPKAGCQENTTRIMFKDFGFYSESSQVSEAAEQIWITQNDWGFDPPSPLSPPASVKVQDTDMKDTRQTSVKPAEQDDQRNPALDSRLSVYTSVSSETLIRQDNHSSDLPAISPSHTATILAAKSSFTANDAPPAKRKRGRPLKVGGRCKRNSDGDSNDDEYRDQLRKDQNRQAAARCREKKKRQIDELRDTCLSSAVENKRLKKRATQMREHILDLRSKILPYMLPAFSGSAAVIPSVVSDSSPSCSAQIWLRTLIKSCAVVEPELALLLRCGTCGCGSCDDCILRVIFSVRLRHTSESFSDAMPASLYAWL